MLIVNFFRSGINGIENMIFLFIWTDISDYDRALATKNRVLGGIG
jgi:hypothetical protein